jgi:hypothetical protein
MQLRETISHKDIGSLSVVFACPECAQETAMMTNPGETQLVTSLGIEVRPGKSGEQGAARCPFSAGLQASSTGEPAPAASVHYSVHHGSPNAVPWTDAATSRLERVPDLVRPMAKIGIEKFAVERGFSEINEQVLEQAREVFGL